VRIIAPSLPTSFETDPLTLLSLLPVGGRQDRSKTVKGGTS
jgi:hypothetical protein